MQTHKMEAAETVDLIVIGAGWHGLLMAKTYLDVNPSSSVTIFESADTVGGVWCQERLYESLRTNNLAGTYEYSDFPMDMTTFGVNQGEPIPGPVVHRYLKAYAEKFDIYRRIRFNCRVHTVTKQSSVGWKIGFISTTHDKTVSQNIESRRLVIAAGLTSEPYVPHFRGQEVFEVPIIHPKNLLKERRLLNSNEVIVMGGSKSGWDAAYMFADAGVQVNWIIRESGFGPTWMAPPYVTPLKKQLEKLVGVRFLAWFSPCIWGDQDGFGWIRRLLHNTVIGRFLVDTFWKILAADVIALNGYDKHAETKKLKPWAPAFWVACSLSILNYRSDFFEYVRSGRIKVYIGDIDRLSSKRVHLANGENVGGEAMICCTGWKPRPAIRFLPEGLDRTLGLPQVSPKLTPAETDRIRATDLTIFNHLPRLKYQPVRAPERKEFRDLRALDPGGHPALAQGQEEEPYRLYRFMVPPALINDRSIGFCGALMTIHTVIVAQAQALWLTAYFGHALEADRLQQNRDHADLKTLFDTEAVVNSAVLHSRYCKWRYPMGFGLRFPDFVFDAVPYVDMLLRDLGLRWRRKQRWWDELFQAYSPSDYRGLVDEWRVRILSKRYESEQLRRK